MAKAFASASGSGSSIGSHITINFGRVCGLCMQVVLVREATYRSLRPVKRGKVLDDMVGRSRAYTLNSEAAPGDILYCSSEYAGQDGSLQMLVITELSCTAKKR